MTGPAFDNSYARLPDGFFARVDPDQAPEPELIKLNTGLAEEIGLDVAWLSSQKGLEMLSGAGVAQGSEPLAMAYAGHQFGGWSPQLGDGRAHLLGEIIAPDGTRLDIQLKGSGATPFSRNGDGKAALGPVLREYIVSEFMAAAGVPTTRALAAVTTGERVQRETGLPGAVLTRIAQSHVRVGTFQYFFAREQKEHIQTLADYVIDRHYPTAKEAENPVLAMLEMVTERQARLISQWMCLGFIHGVMNTDNMQVAGETIDYGPCAFMDRFHPNTVFSSIDRNGRYAWVNQPNIGVWNLSRLAEALLPVLHPDQDAAIKLAEGAVGRFSDLFNETLNAGFAAKLGIPVDAAFMQDMFKLMADQGCDFTLFFSELTRIAGGGKEEPFAALFVEPLEAQLWLEQWRKRHDPALLDGMKAANPVFIPRNHRVEEAIQSALAGDYTLFHTLVSVVTRPFDPQPEHAEYERAPTEDQIVQQTFCGT
ncbi:protein adenylyltransferase SelO [Neptunicoccus sediminis]|uniref:protein adenylyltransferase SelO n=1 Tax=Neptunicoccus sediminis TaxID=1892596 RepID=UPI000845DE6B|nr:YdiU family protein [Neptunicoccus sediminis]